LVDSGAAVSIIKYSSLNNINKVNESEKLFLTGLQSEKSIETLGTIKIDMAYNNEKFCHTFHVINYPINIKSDGIIGLDFLHRHNVSLDFSQDILISGNNNIKLTPYSNDLKIEKPGKMLKARSITFIMAKILNKDIVEGITPEMEIKENVFLSKCITAVNKEGEALVSILNASEKDLNLLKIELVLENTPKTSEIFTNNIKNENKFINRKRKLESLICVKHLNSEELNSLLEICNSYEDIFHLEGDYLTHTDTIKHNIYTENKPPIAAKTYRYPEIHKDEVNKQINKMLENKIIKHSKSPWSAPLWVVPKKLDQSGKIKWRIVVDYRKLNQATVDEVYPIPQIVEILDQLSHSKYFTTLDLASGFHQIPMSEEDSEKTAFTTPNGHFEFLRMPFGLKNAPARFQRLMDIVLTGLQGTDCFVYLDDIVIHAASIQDHKNKLKKIFQRLRDNNLKLQPEKCEFMRKEVTYLGHVISTEGVKPNPEKTKIINEYPIPTNQKDIRAFLGLLGYYRRFIKDFAKITKPLTSLLKKDVNFQWTEIEDKCFDYLKKILITEPILQYPDFNREFVLRTDASNFALGAVLSQGEIGSDLPIAYASRTLNASEQNYSTIEKELLGIVWAVNHFRPYIYGRKFKIITDHRALTWLFNVKDPGSKLVRWRLKLEEFQYEIIYKSGKSNSNADCLSRIKEKESSAIIENENKNIINSCEVKLKLSYEQYLNDLINLIDTDTHIIEINDHLLDRKGNIAYFSCTDVQDPQNSFFMEILQRCNTVSDVLLSRENEKLTINKSPSNDKSQVFYHCFIKNLHFEKSTYSDLFYVLQNLRNQLMIDKVEEVHLPLPNDNYTSFSVIKFREMLKYLFNHTNIKLYICLNKLIKPEENKIQEILKENHDGPLNGHPGYFRLYHRLRQKYYWKGMQKDIKNYLNNCQSCQKNKTNRHPNKQPMVITSTSELPFDRIYLDLVGPLPMTENGNKYILTIQDDLTKFSYGFPIENQESLTVAKCLVKFITLFGIPESILTDQGSEFNSSLMKDVNKLLHIKHISSTPYHPQTNGALERSHSTLKDYLKHFIKEDQSNWDEYIHLAMFSYNTNIHSTTKYSPHELLFGRKPKLPSSITDHPTIQYSYDDFANDLKYKLRQCQNIAKENIQKSKLHSKQEYDKQAKVKSFSIDQMVYLKNNITTKGISKKLAPDYKGPYKIVNVHDNNNVTLQLKNNKFKRVHTDLIKEISTL
jgi:transposase InsO family protein